MRVFGGLCERFRDVVAMKTEFKRIRVAYIVEMDGREVYHSTNYHRARRYAWNLIHLYRDKEVIVTLHGLIVGI